MALPRAAHACVAPLCVGRPPAGLVACQRSSVPATSSFVCLNCASAVTKLYKVPMARSGSHQIGKTGRRATQPLGAESFKGNIWVCVTASSSPGVALVLGEGLLMCRLRRSFAARHRCA